MPPYGAINSCLPLAEDIRLQHRFAATAVELSRKTAFDMTETQRLLQIHYMLTVKRGRVMDRSCFSEFADVFLSMRNADALDKIHLLRCRENQSHLTGSEFVALLSLLLRGSLTDTIKHCFDVYTEMVRSPAFIKKEDVMWMARRNTAKLCKLAAVEQHDRDFVEFIMDRMDHDRDSRISFEDYRKSVSENVVWLEFLGPVLPDEESARTFTHLFSPRPYVNHIEKATLELRHRNAGRLKSTIIVHPTEGGESSLSLSSDTTIGDYDAEACDNCRSMSSGYDFLF